MYSGSVIGGMVLYFIMGDIGKLIGGLLGFVDFKN